MKRKFCIFLMLGLYIFSMAGIAFSQAIQLPEASLSAPQLKKVKKEDKTSTRDTAALKLKLILSQPLPLFVFSFSPKVTE